ncbi:MAG: MGMT family protein, partial [Alistipes sp.]|nr:MGMT family protein [Alistipes sp.]
MTTNDLRRKILSAEGLTDFQRRVYLALLDIPHGTTITYGELARRIG